MRLALLGVLLLPLPLLAQTAPRSYPEGEKLIMGYFKSQVKQISDAALSNLTTKEAWESQRQQRREQFLEMMGLWPMPKRDTPLNATITGTVEGDGFIVEKLHFQSSPGLYVTANLYKPKNATGKRPTILYVCGHGNVVENGISYGSKVHYQYHPAWFAKHGYICLILDTLQLGEIQGLHHGTYKLGLWWWQSRGYTPGGIELWNGIRALDYLESRPEVDATKIGLTGRSGGGASSWWIAAADDRVKAVAPIAGIADLQAQLVEGEVDRLKLGVIAGHCDCMFLVNKYRWDFSQIAAMIAPRPLLLGNSDADDIFPVGGYRRIATKVSQVYELYGAGDKFQLLETKGPHTDTPELRIGINKFMNRYLKGDTTTKVEDDLPPKLKPQQLKVFSELPLDSINEQVHEVFSPEYSQEMPKTDRELRYWWAIKQTELKKRLEREVFAGWPKNPPAIQVKQLDEVFAHQVRMTSLEFNSEEGLPLKMFVLRGDDQIEPEAVEVTVLDAASWATTTTQHSRAFAKVFGIDPASAREMPLNQPYGPWFQKNARVYIVPRGIGPTQWADPGSSFDIQVQRRFALIGQTLDGQRVWDIRRGLAAGLKFLNIKKPGVPIQMNGSDQAAGLALFASLFESSVTHLDLTSLPESLRVGPTLLNAAKVLDMGLALALAANSRVVNLNRNHNMRASELAIPISIGQATFNKNFRVNVPVEPPPPPPGMMGQMRPAKR